MSKLSFCSPADADRITATVDAVRRGLGEKIRAVLLVGPAVPPARHPGANPLELLIVVSDLPVPALSNLAHQAREALAAGVCLRLLTQRELLRSADVFTLELAEARARHIVLVGDDPFADLYFTQGELRLSIEQALRTLARELRHAVLSAVSDEAVRPAARKVLAVAIDRVAVIAANALRLRGEKDLVGEVDLIGRLAELAGTEAQAVLGWVQAVRQGPGPADPVPALADVLLWVEAATTMVDRWGAEP